MTAPIVVGRETTPTGADAVAVATRLAAATGAPLRVVHVEPSPDASIAESLIGTAHDCGASHIVVGAANGGMRGRHRLGAVATALLHAADVPVVLAPEGARRTPADTGMPRLTVAIGTRTGADVLLEHGLALATATRASLRLLSLMALDLPAGIDGIDAGASHADEVLVHVRRTLPPGIDTDAVVGFGASIEDAVSRLRWLPGELVVVGTSRLARPRRLFLGSTAAKMLRELPVPMIVVPRTRPRKKAGI